MIGAILGDIIGSPYEFDRGNKSKDFPLFSKYSKFTDDTVMTIAVCRAFLDVKPDASDDVILKSVEENLRKFGTFLGKIHRKRIDFCKYYVLLFRHLVRHLFPAPAGSLCIYCISL